MDWTSKHQHFNPRLPRGRRLDRRNAPIPGKIFQFTPPSREATFCSASKRAPEKFQSTPPSREATADLAAVKAELKFQSTPPSREATNARPVMAARDGHFNPRLPRGRRPGQRGHAPVAQHISIHASLAGGDSIVALLLKLSVISIHASLAGGDAGAS